jgi:hypothetical protein
MNRREFLTYARRKQRKDASTVSVGQDFSRLDFVFEKWMTTIPVYIRDFCIL